VNRATFRAGLASVAVGALVACGVQSGDASKPVELATASTPYTPHRAMKAGSAELFEGEDCSEAGQTACKTGLCLHAHGGFAKGYVCTRACAGNDDCPDAWSCEQVFPGAPNGLCMPPKRWVAQKALPRKASAGSTP